MAKANTFSKICKLENPRATPMASTCDLCVRTGGGKCGTSGPAFSFGLFQINILANDVGDVQCQKAAFTQNSRNYACAIGNQTVYNNCVAAAMNNDINRQAMVALSRNGTNLAPWGCTAWRIGLTNNNPGCGNLRKLACATNP
jgi:hypothetical protein